VLALALVGTACGGGGKKSQNPGHTATTRPKPSVAPLTGLPDPTGVASTRCAITVKVDNTQAGHPKYGVGQADVVYEEVVEGFVTRLAAIFNSHAPARVGPVRSVRRTDQSIVWPIGGVFVYSGGAPYAIQSISTAPVVRLDETTAGSLMFRDHSRSAPYNLFARVDQMYERCGKPVPPPPLFSYRAAGEAAAGTPAASVHVAFRAGFDVTWQWDAASGTWKRSIFHKPETVQSGVQLAPKNVVVMAAQYVGGDRQNFGAEAQLTGSGSAWVFTDGKAVKGTWSRPDKSAPARFLDAAGNDIKLTPGQTWVELPEPSYAITVTP
jgi:hypothetical protein